MRAIYEEQRIPLQIRRLMIFAKLCRKARSYLNEFAYLNTETELALKVIYFERSKRYVAYGGVFDYAHTRREILEKEIDKIHHEELVMCAITIKAQAFTNPVRTPLALLWQWNKQVKNKPCNYVYDNPHHFFAVNDELEKDYLPHEYHKHLLAIKNLPLWDDV